MKLIIRVALAAMACGLLATSLVGCGERRPYAESAATEESARLRRLLREQPALPDGFSVKTREAWHAPFPKMGPSCMAAFQTASGRPPVRSLEAHAAASYQGDVLGEVAAVGVAVYGSAQAGWHLGELGRAMDRCPRMVAAQPGKATRLRSSPLVVPDLDGDVVSRQLRGRLNGYPYALDVVFVREGDKLLSVVHTGLGTVDVHRTAELAKTFVELAR
ncbi:hypothetical protein AB0B45_32465 [Nonomuraea sp. NPDC049152]|uniref:hypothetical protein n=1 Tax=Nonomuraea sp. NPDC049152 TaxID=3154350 RepID=UPI00340FE52F